jgi:hypothetical protein
MDTKHYLRGTECTTPDGQLVVVVRYETLDHMVETKTGNKKGRRRIECWHHSQLTPVR